MTDTIARDIASTLNACGLQHFFMLTGGDQPLWIALRDAGIRMVVARSEASAVYMADGFARASGKAAVAYGQAGPGAANVAAALADPDNYRIDRTRFLSWPMVSQKTLDIYRSVLN